MNKGILRDITQIYLYNKWVIARTLINFLLRRVNYTSVVPLTRNNSQIILSTNSVLTDKGRKRVIFKGVSIGKKLPQNLLTEIKNLCAK